MTNIPLISRAFEHRGHDRRVRLCPTSDLRGVSEPQTSSVAVAPSPGKLSASQELELQATHAENVAFAEKVR